MSDQDSKPSGWWWLSFVDPDRLTGEKFLGAAIVPGAGMADAIRHAWFLECNPGGEVEGMSILEGRVPSESWRNRLLSKGEALEIGSWATSRWPKDVGRYSRKRR